MTTKIWEGDVVPGIIEQVNKLRVDKAKPNQTAVLILDGFGCHSYSIKVLLLLLQ